MPEIVVTVKNKMAVGDGSVIVCNNSDYVVRFALDSEWDALALRTMRIVYDSYSHTDIAFSGDTVALPTIIDRTSIGIGLYSGDIHTSTCAMFDCERTADEIAELEAMQANIPTPSPTPEQRLDVLENTTDDIILMMADMIGGE